MKSIDNLLRTISTVYLRISQVVLLALVLGILLEVFMRYFLGRAFVGSAELTQLAITWVVFLMAFVLFRTRRHIVVTALVDMLGPRVNRLFDAIINLATIVLSIYVLVQLGNVWEFLGLKTPVFGIPDTVFKISPVFCFVPMALQAALNLAAPWLEPSDPHETEHV
ncbi:TRAP transporter small permease [Celeribacter indicus]|uniref:TRAP transporter small permease protein n=1 Tax=Celeribacter indicus TaxID=1208324 RepID=A0A0B5E6U6_9RHOB|nr:TRAP transporter small permease [Celeribacter indicus]AJE48721.1 tripartite ATP-independent periplasmic transporter DctQ component [Celeribacter indicus]SDX12135.1 TRAP-type C4-dicarboxylate transport system, small permease component [Celeribacter indicus]